MKLRKLNRLTHRDLGYLIAGMTIIYAVSGIALNHKHDWNSNYIIDQRTFTTDIRFTRDSTNEEKVFQLLEELGETKNFKTSYYPTGDKLTLFLVGGSAIVNTDTGEGYVERISKRPLFYQFNFLHYNPGRWWKWFSDIFCVSLILVTITGLFILKGKHGITRRGAVLTAIGIILPLIFLFIY
ncbi:MAG: PepSY-associated TM helix domain-containing protein [Bacteroidales bacterium]|nr:PepSY-associated TM helix domain-containing protein [Bacteroidales bacterium]